MYFQRSTFRTVTVTTGVDYVPHTMLQYQVLIDRIEHVGYIPTVLEGAPPAHGDPSDEHFVESADDLQCSFDGFIEHNCTTTSTPLETRVLSTSQILPTKDH